MCHGQARRQQSLSSTVAHIGKQLLHPLEKYPTPLYASTAALRRAENIFLRLLNMYMMTPLVRLFIIAECSIRLSDAAFFDCRPNTSPRVPRRVTMGVCRPTAASHTMHGRFLKLRASTSVMKQEVVVSRGNLDSNL